MLFYKHVFYVAAFLVNFSRRIVWKYLGHRLRFFYKTNDVVKEVWIQSNLFSQRIYSGRKQSIMYILGLALVQ